MKDIRQIAAQLSAVSDTPLLEARLLREAVDGDLDKLNDAIQRRQKHEPISKIIGKRGFWKSEFITTSDVLDPRPDSEMMIESVLSFFPDKEKEYRILDIGVGSGCLLFSLLDEYPNAKGLGIDKSDKALSVALKNRNNRSAELRLTDFTTKDWTDGMGKFDVIISNPPYIPTSDIVDLSPDVRLYDPIEALDGGEDGLNAYRFLSSSVADILKSDGFLFLEIGIHQEDEVKTLFRSAGFKYKSTRYDFGGIPRILIFQK